MSFFLSIENYWENIWGWVKTLYPFCSHQNSWDLWMFIPLKMVLIGIDPYPYGKHIVFGDCPAMISRWDGLLIGPYLSVGGAQARPTQFFS